MINCDKIIRAKIVVTQNRQREILNDAAIVIDKDLITHIGKDEDVISKYNSLDTIDLRNAVAMPGLINSHTHTPMVFLRGISDDKNLEEWLNDNIFPLEQKLTPEIAYMASLYSFCEQIRTGTTAVLDMYIFQRDIFKAADKIGIRIRGGETVTNTPTPSCKTPEEALYRTIDDSYTYSNHPRIFPIISIHSFYNIKLPIVRNAVSLSEQYNLPIQIHLAENSLETNKVKEMYGKRPLELAEEVGLLKPTTTLAHCVDLSDTELNLLKTKKVSVVHNPKSNLKLGSGIAKIPEMLNRKIPVALGTDGAASNNSLNLFSEMQFAALIHKGNSKNPTVMPSQQVLDLATIGSAHAAGFYDSGSIIAGNKADLIALDLSSFSFNPGYNIISDLTYSANGSEVIYSMIDGNTVYCNGKFNNIDYDSLLKEMQSIKQYIKSYL